MITLGDIFNQIGDLSEDQANEILNTPLYFKSMHIEIKNGTLHFNQYNGDYFHPIQEDCFAITKGNECWKILLTQFL